MLNIKSSLRRNVQSEQLEDGTSWPERFGSSFIGGLWETHQSNGLGITNPASVQGGGINGPRSPFKPYDYRM